MSEWDEAAFFKREGRAYVPAPHAASPWGPLLLNGRVIAGALAYEIEREHQYADLRLARLTVDLFRSPPFGPVEIETQLVRHGRRIRAIDAVLLAGGTAVARASTVMLRRSEQPPGSVWRPPEWEVPQPDELSPEPPMAAGGGESGAWSMTGRSGMRSTACMLLIGRWAVKDAIALNAVA